MASLFHVTIITPDKKVYEGEIRSLVAPAETGYLGVLAHHAPLMTTLAPGTITLTDAADRKSAFDSRGRGFLEVSDNKAVLLVDSAEPRP